MSLPKKLRFEVFKRDNFTCAYCGKTPPAITLEVDHINPRRDGGTDNIDNLITACFDCNRGKSHIPLEKIPNTISENLEVIKERESQMREYNRWVMKAEKRITKEIQTVVDIFEKRFPQKTFTEEFRNLSIKKFLRLLPLCEVMEAMEIACYKMKESRDVGRYFCGICWNKSRFGKQE